MWDLTFFFPVYLMKGFTQDSHSLYQILLLEFVGFWPGATLNGVKIWEKSSEMTYDVYWLLPRCLIIIVETRIRNCRNYRKNEILGKFRHQKFWCQQFCICWTQHLSVIVVQLLRLQWWIVYMSDHVKFEIKERNNLLYRLWKDKRKVMRVM